MLVVAPSPSGRRLLLLRGRCRRRDGEVPEGPIEIITTEPSPSGCPVLGGELEVAFAGPVGHHANDVSEVLLGVEAVERAGGQERKRCWLRRWRKDLCQRKS